MKRRDFLRASAAAPLLAALPPELTAHDGPHQERDANWDSGALRHLLPTVSDRQVLIKASFAKPLDAAPVLQLGTTKVTGTMTDTAGEFWQFHATNLEPGRAYT